MHEESVGPLIVKIVEGTWSGSTGPVVGVDQQRGTVTVRIRVPGVTFGARRGRRVEVDVRQVRRNDRET